MRAAAFTFFLILALAGAAASLAFLGGRAAADAPGAFERGVEEGERLGRARARAEFAPGAAGYRAVLERGRRSGFEDGRRAGRVEGVRRGRARGRAAVFGGFRAGWDVRRWYVVSLAPTGQGIRISSRVALERGAWYGLCSGRTGLCRRGDEPRRARARALAGAGAGALRSGASRGPSAR